MRFIAPALAAIALLFASAAYADPPDADTLAVELGRWEVMLGEIYEVTPQIHGSVEIGFQDGNPAHMGQRLRDAVWQFNMTRDRMCFFGVQPSLSCVRAYTPVWLRGAPDHPDLAELQRRSNSFGAVVTRYWDAICERARTGRPEDQRLQVCPME